MANTYDTSALPLGTTSPKALYNNASNFDEAMNSNGPSWTDRFGLRRETWTGMQVMVSDYLEAMGFEATHLTYVDGSPLTVLRPTQLIDRAGSVYKVKQPASFPANLTGTWSTDALLLTDVGDGALRALLAQPDGSYYVGFIQSGTGAVARTSLSKMREVVSILDFGGVGDGVFDNYSAMLAAHTAHPVVYYPAGTWRCLGKVVVSGKFGILGDGANITIISFEGPSQGFDVIQPTAQDAFSVRHVTFMTNDTTAAFTGLKIDGDPQIDPTVYGGRRLLGYRTVNRGYINDVTFTGTTNAAGWGIGLNLKSIMNFTVDTFTYEGIATGGAGNLSGTAILLNGDGIPTDVRLTKIWVFFAFYSVLVPDYMEGIHLDNFEFVNVTYGVIGRYTAGISVFAEPICGCLAVYLDQGHANAFQAGVILANSNANFFSRLNIYLQPRAGDAAARAIQISGGSDHRIRDVFMLGDTAGNVKTDNYGIVLSDARLSFIDNVTASSLLSAVFLQDAPYNEVSNIQSRACISVVVADPTSTNNSIGPGKGHDNFGPKYSAPLDNTIRTESFVAVSSQAVAAGASATLTVALPAGAFSQAPTFATIVFSVSTINYEWIYLRASSSATSAQFLIKPAYPATAVPAETVEFGVNVKGI